MHWYYGTTQGANLLTVSTLVVSRGDLPRIRTARWETEYERLWARETAALMIQRNLRGWLARTAAARSSFVVDGVNHFEDMWTKKASSWTNSAY